MNVLGVVMSVRDLKPCLYWIDQITFIDKLVIKNYSHDDAHKIARDFFLEHKEYTHFLFLSEDIIATPCHVSLIIDDARRFPNSVVCGLSNVDFNNNVTNISFRNMYNIVVHDRSVYRHPRPEDLVLGQKGFPFVKVWFQGNTLACYPRKVVEKLSFKPYHYHSESSALRYFGYKRKHGMMFDFQMCRELYELGIDIICDLRAFVMHFKIPLGSFKFADKPRTVRLFKKNGEVELIREDPPYVEKIEDRVRVSKRELNREEFRRFIREKFLGLH